MIYSNLSELQLSEIISKSQLFLQVPIFPQFFPKLATFFRLATGCHGARPVSAASRSRRWRPCVVRQPRRRNGGAPRAPRAPKPLAEAGRPPRATRVTWRGVRGWMEYGHRPIGIHWDPWRWGKNGSDSDIMIYHDILWYTMIYWHTTNLAVLELCQRCFGLWDDGLDSSHTSE